MHSIIYALFYSFICLYIYALFYAFMNALFIELNALFYSCFLLMPSYWRKCPWNMHVHSYDILQALQTQMRRTNETHHFIT